MLNLESLNSLNQNNVIKKTSLKTEDSKSYDKDFQTYLSKEKEVSKTSVENDIKDKPSIVEKENKPLKVNKESSDKIGENVKEKLESNENEDSSDVDKETLVLISSLFNNVNPIENIEEFNFENVSEIELENISEVSLETMVDSNFKDIGQSVITNIEEVELGDIKELLSDTFDELKTILNGNNENQNNIDMLNILIGAEVKPETYKDVLVNIKDLLIEEVNLIENNETGLSNLQVNEVENELKNSIATLFNTLDKEEFEGIVEKMGSNEKSSVLNTLKALMVNEENKEVSSKEISLPIKENNISVNNLLNSDVNSGNTFESSEDKFLKEEEKILAKVMGDSSETKFSNVITTSYNRFNNMVTKVEQVPVYKETMGTDIIKNVKYMITNNVQELTVKIYPKELGEITIKILSEEGIIRADIKATSKETYNLLNANIQDIKNNLGEQNIKIQEVNIGIYNEDTTFFSNENDNSRDSENGKSSNNKIVSGTLEEEKVENVLIDNTVNMLA